MAKKIHSFKHVWAIMYLGKMMWELRISNGYIEIKNLYTSKKEAQKVFKESKLDKDYTVRRIEIHG